MTGFFFASTFVRWAFRAYTKNEFDEEHPIEICKFCQIIKEAQTNKSLVLYSDDLVVAFRDIRPQAK